MEFVVEVRDLPHLKTLIQTLRQTEQVARADRIMRESEQAQKKAK
jgi:hypothetical protein